jgi:hypothetical protein
MKFRLKAADGRFRLTECADQETMLRLIQSIPSKRVEPIKQWLAKTGSEKLDAIALQQQMVDPEVLFKARVQKLIAKGYEPEWAWIRAQGDLVRNELTDEWEDRGAKGGELGMLTGIMHRGAFGLLPSEHKTYKTFPKRKSCGTTSLSQSMASRSLQKLSGFLFTGNVILKGLRTSSAMLMMLARLENRPAKLLKPPWGSEWFLQRIIFT